MNYKIEKHFRYQGFDYAADGYYFVTICAANRQSFFGEIKQENMELSPIGEIAERCWLKIPNYHPFARLDEFVVMPNHIHGIIIIDRGVGTQDDAFYEKYKNKFGPQSGNLSSMVRGFKTGVTKDVGNINSNFSWQSRFHDRIVRNDEELNGIRQYIVDNPAKWFYDRNNPKNIGKSVGPQYLAGKSDSPQSIADPRGIAFLRNEIDYDKI